MIIQTLTVNFAAPIRFEMLEGREYLVAPMVMITEGVHSGSNGPIYYPVEELSNPAAVMSWNHKPVVVYHPNDQKSSACTEQIIENQKVGMILNTHWDSDTKKLRAEAWLEINRLEKVDKRVLESLENGNIMEVSTGVYTENEVIQGTWNTESYSMIARNLRADHLAILPDKVGACSTQDGAGLLQMNCRSMIGRLKKNGIIQNEDMSFGDIRFALHSKLRERFGTDAWIEDVFQSYVVFDRTDLDKVFRLGYTASEGNVELSTGEPEEVRRKTEFIPVTNEQESDMKKKEVVDGLISNEALKWTEEDRKFLMSLNEDQLAKFEPEPPKVENDDDKKEEKVVDDPPPVENNKKEEKKDPKQITVNEYIEQAPAEIREMLSEGLLTRNEQKKKMVETILNAEGCRFTKEQLEKKPLGELQAISDLIPKPVQNGSDYPTYTYVGAAGSHVQNSDEDVEPLLVPVMNFGSDT